MIKSAWYQRVITIPKENSLKIRKPGKTLIIDKSIPLTTGLCNFENTCYMNSILQCFLHSPLINQYFFSHSYRNHFVNKDSIVFSLLEKTANLFSELKSTNSTKIIPMDFYSEFININKSFSGGEQHDSHEFLVILLGNLHEALCEENNNMTKTLTIRNPSLLEEQKISKDQ